jgi:hypothetical protein
MLEQDLARIRSHRNNIHRYRSLLLTELSDLERNFIVRRMADEQATLHALVAEAYPVTFTVSEDRSAACSGMSQRTDRHTKPADQPTQITRPHDNPITPSSIAFSHSPEEVAP